MNDTRKLSEESSIKELLDLISKLKDETASTCQDSMGTIGCDEANSLELLYNQITDILKIY